MRSKSLWVFVPTAMALAAACNSNNNNSTTPACGADNVATTAVDWVYATNVEAGLYFASIDPIAQGFFTFATSQATMAATAVAQAAGNNFANGCAMATANQNVVTFVLSKCSGPLGITNLSGTVVATINATGNGQVQTQLTSSGLTTNGATIQLDTSGTATIANGQKTLTATSMSTGTGPDGNSIAHGGMYAVVWPTSPGCATINGTFSGSVADAGLDAAAAGASAADANAFDASPADASSADASAGTTTSLFGYVACTGKCAQSGTVTTMADGESVTLTFDGSSSAQCTASNGQSATLSLKCP